jgi:hypothetical protein
LRDVAEHRGSKDPPSFNDRYGLAEISAFSYISPEKAQQKADYASWSHWLCLG